jgi:hypothetical protein
MNLEAFPSHSASLSVLMTDDPVVPAAPSSPQIALEDDVNSESSLLMRLAVVYHRLVAASAAAATQS